MGRRAPCHVLYKASQESCTHPVAPAWLRGALRQPCLLCQLQKLPPKDREGWEGSSWLLPPRKPFGWGWETAGSCQHSPGAAPHRSCHQRHQVTAGWKGESGKAGVGESSRRAGISFLCPARSPTLVPPSCSPCCLCCSRTCSPSPSKSWGWTLRMGAGRIPHPKNYPQHHSHTGHPCIQHVPSLSRNVPCLLHTASVGPTHRPGQMPPDPRPHAAFGILGEVETIGKYLQPACCIT